MSDASMAAIGRNLAEALSKFAHDRAEDDRKAIALLHFELCFEWRNEIAAAAAHVAAEPLKPEPAQ